MRKKVYKNTKQYIGWDSNPYLKDITLLGQRLRPLVKLWCYYTQRAQRKIFISPIPRKGILAVVNCQLLVDSYEMEIDSAEN